MDIDNISESNSDSSSEISPEEEYEIFQERKKYHNRKKPNLSVLKIAEEQYRRMLFYVSIWDEHMKLKKLVKEFVKLYSRESVKANFKENKRILENFWDLMKRIDNEIDTMLFIGSFGELKM